MAPHERDDFFFGKIRARVERHAMRAHGRRCAHAGGFSHAYYMMQAGREAYISRQKYDRGCHGRR